MRRLPGKFLRPVRNRYTKIVLADGVTAGDKWLRDTVADGLQRIKIGHAKDDEAIRAEARKRAGECVILLGSPDPATGEVITATRYQRAASYALWQRVTPPQVGKGKVTLDSAAARLKCQYWWRRQLRKRDGRAVETLGRDLNLINRRAQCYASDEAVERRRQQKARNRALLDAVQATNELGQTLTLGEIADKSVSNPKLRRGELMCRLRGFEEYAEAHGHVGMFFTISCPSKFHRSHSQSGSENNKWNGSTPRDAARYLSALWARCRAEFIRGGVSVYGFRIAEPHHDGCPHWHILLFGGVLDLAAARLSLRAQALREDGAEAGATEHRFKAETIDPAKGSACGYLAKYISKNIDGHALEADADTGPQGSIDTGLTGSDSARRVDAWASTWGIRQFQQIGGPPVGVWRELRRLNVPAVSETVEAAREAADGGDWNRYMEVQGMRRAAGAPWPVRLVLDAAGRATRYGDAAVTAVIGVWDGLLWACSRLHSWTFDLLRAASAPWTRVNNCTALAAMEAGP